MYGFGLDFRAAPPDADGYANSTARRVSLPERAMGFEPTTSALGRLHSTTELRPQRSCEHSTARIETETSLPRRPSPLASFRNAQALSETENLDLTPPATIRVGLQWLR